MAHVLAQAGRMDAARTALSVSRALPGEALNPFCRALFTHATKGRLSNLPHPRQPTAPPPGTLVLAQGVTSVPGAI